MENYITFGQGPHQCLGKDLNIVHTRTMLKVFAGLKGLRRTPGDEGRLKCITKPGGFKMYLTPDWSQLTPYPTSKFSLFAPFLVLDSLTASSHEDHVGWHRLSDESPIGIVVKRCRVIVDVLFLVFVAQVKGFGHAVIVYILGLVVRSFMSPACFHA
jgi:hypothetical protein